jgi:hypothetical protein
MIRRTRRAEGGGTPANNISLGASAAVRPGRSPGEDVSKGATLSKSPGRSPGQEVSKGATLARRMSTGGYLGTGDPAGRKRLALSQERNVKLGIPHYARGGSTRSKKKSDAPHYADGGFFSGIGESIDNFGNRIGHLGQTVGNAMGMKRAPNSQLDQARQSIRNFGQNIGHAFAPGRIAAHARGGSAHEKKLHKNLHAVYKILHSHFEGGSESDHEVNKKWIKGAINPKNKGALHKSLHVPTGQKIPLDKLHKAEHSKSPKIRKRAQLAETLRGFHRPRGR